MCASVFLCVLVCASLRERMRVKPSITMKYQLHNTKRKVLGKRVSNNTYRTILDNYSKCTISQQPWSYLLFSSIVTKVNVPPKHMVPALVSFWTEKWRLENQINNTIRPTKSAIIIIKISRYFHAQFPSTFIDHPLFSWQCSSEIIWAYWCFPQKSYIKKYMICIVNGCRKP